MSRSLEKLKLAYPAVSYPQLSAEALRRGMVEMLAMRPSPTLMAMPLRRVG